jgi:hypothetical protein
MYVHFNKIKTLQWNWQMYRTWMWQNAKDQKIRIRYTEKIYLFNKLLLSLRCKSAVSQ